MTLSVPCLRYPELYFSFFHWTLLFLSTVVYSSIYPHLQHSSVYILFTNFPTGLSIRHVSCQSCLEWQHPFSTSNHPTLHIYFIISFLLNIMYDLWKYHIILLLIILRIVMSLAAALKISYLYGPSLIYALLCQYTGSFGNMVDISTRLPIKTSVSLLYKEVCLFLSTCICVCM